MDQLDILVVDAGAHTVRAGRAQDFPTDAESPYVVLPSAVRASGLDDADSTQTSVSKVLTCYLGQASLAVAGLNASGVHTQTRTIPTLKSVSLALTCTAVSQQA